MKNSVLQKALATALTAVVLTGVFPVSALNVEGQANVSDGIGTSDIVLDAQAIQMDVSVNMYLPFTFDSQGTVYTATDATVINNSYGPVEITAVNATGQNGWSIVSKDTEWHKLAVDTKYLALSLNDDWADETGNIALNSPDWTVIDGNGGTLRYTYDGKIPAQSQALDEEAIGNIVWTIGWYEGEGTQEPGPEPEEPAETGYILLPPAVKEVTGYDGTSRVDVVIPATVMDEGVQKNVEVIGAMTFQNKPITGITIPETTKTIKGYAFTGCVQMTTVRINSTNVVIENDAFSTCPKITDVYFAGTQEQWEALSIGTGNDTLKSATIHYGEGEEIPSPSIHEHNWLSTWANDETYHWHECSAGGCDIVNNSEKNGYAEHVYDDEEDTTCNICGYVRKIEAENVSLNWEGYTPAGEDYIRLSSYKGDGPDVVVKNAYKYGSKTYNNIVLGKGTGYKADSPFYNRSSSVKGSIIVEDGVKAATNANCLFYYVSATTIDASGLDMSEVTRIGDIFSECYKLQTVDISGWDTSKVIGMSGMFYKCSALTTITGIKDLNTSSADDMSLMFYNCSSLTSLDLSGWDVSKVNNMRNMFYGCTNLKTLDISTWDINSATDVTDMFKNCTATITVKDNATKNLLQQKASASGCTITVK